jgi:sensor histidine kinase YesM
MINLKSAKKIPASTIEATHFTPLINDDQWMGHHIIWLRFVINNKQAKDSILNLVFERPVSMIEVFRKDDTLFSSLGKTGTRHPSTQTSFIYKFTELAIPIRPHKLDTFYLYSFDHVSHVHNYPFPRLFTGRSLPQDLLKSQFYHFERERWFYFFLAGFSFLMAFWAFFKSAVNNWDKSNLYCGLMFLSNFFNTWFWTRTISLPILNIFTEISVVHPIGKWFNNLTALFMWLLYRSFLNTRKERPPLHSFLTVCIWILGVLNIAHIIFSLQFEMQSYTLFIEKTIEITLLVVQLILPFLLFPYWRHSIYRYVALSSWIVLLGLSCYLMIFRFGWDDYLPIWFHPVFILFIPFAMDGILFMVALTFRDRQIAIENIRLQHQNTVNELKALRSQMNPHFIFNCLNAIKSYTLNNDTEGVNFYLTKFSKLMRQVLENSRNEKVTLSNELETLTLYMDMEKLRAGDKFNYDIQIADDVETDFIEVPPMLIQPYVENAIWHGLMHKEGIGKVSVIINQKEDKKLIINILDNGIGREKAAVLKSKTATRHKSFGMQITAERMDIIRDLYKIDTTLTIEDLKNADGSAAGTKVILEIPI